MIRLPLRLVRFFNRKTDEWILFPEFAREVRKNPSDYGTPRQDMADMLFAHMKEDPTWHGELSMDKIAQKAAMTAIKYFPEEE